MCDHRSEEQPAGPVELPLSIQPSAQMPSPWVRRFIGGVPHQGSVLDVACGGGRHLQLCLETGHKAVGVDRDVGAVQGYAQVPGFELIEADLETGAPPPFAGRRFAGVIVTNYLWRPLLPYVVGAVADDGILLYETFAVGNERYGRPRNPDFLLRPGELVGAVHPTLVVIAFEHVALEQPKRIVQRIAAVGRRHRWLVEGWPA